MLREYYVEKLGSEGKAHACALWAFGKGFESAEVSTYPKLWNKLHGRIYKIKMNEAVFESSDKIIKLWREHMSKKKGSKRTKAPCDDVVDVDFVTRKQLNIIIERFSGLHKQVNLYRAGVEKQGARLIKAQQNIEMLTKRIKDMDKKMHAITKRMATAERDIAKHKPKVAAKVLRGAEKANEKLVKIDKKVRDPMISKAKSAAKKGVKLPKNFGKVR